MPLYAYLTPKVDFKRKSNHHQSFIYEWRMTARTIRKFRIGPSLRIESRIGRTIRNRIESRSFAGPYCLLPSLPKVVQCDLQSQVHRPNNYATEPTDIVIVLSLILKIYHMVC